MKTVQPSTPEELAEALRTAADTAERIRMGGAFTKSGMAGPVAEADVCITSTRMNRVRQYDPRDLTVSVEAGMRFCELERLLAENQQMVPLDPPHRGSATVGGVVAANCSGPRRRGYGTARDLMIGMTFATLEGKLVQSGGMVVKNVAGLDMAKLMAGSFGTLAAIAVVNLKVIPAPTETRTFLAEYEEAGEAFKARNQILAGVLQPAAIDLLSPKASARVGRNGWLLAIGAGGNHGVLARFSVELASCEVLEGDCERAFWRAVEEFSPAYMAEHPGGAVVRVSATLQHLQALMESAGGGAVVARAATGTVYAHFDSANEADSWAELCQCPAVMEYCPEERKRALTLWPKAGADFETMVRIKQMFDPQGILNRGRLYGRI